MHVAIPNVHFGKEKVGCSVSQKAFHQVASQSRVHFTNTYRSCDYRDHELDKLGFG